MKIRIKANSGIYGAEGEMAEGAELTLAEVPAGWAGRYDVIDPDAKPAGAKAKGGGKTPVTNPAKYEAKADGDEFFIVDGNGAKQGAALNEADAKAFNGMSDDDKAAFVAEHAKA